MLNDWNWEKVCDFQYELKDTSGEVVAFLYHSFEDEWYCKFLNYHCGGIFFGNFEGIKNGEEAVWQATIWIYRTCNKIANSYHHIRDHLPSLAVLRERSEANNENLHF